MYMYILKFLNILGVGGGGDWSLEGEIPGHPHSKWNTV